MVRRWLDPAPLHTIDKAPKDGPSQHGSFLQIVWGISTSNTGRLETNKSRLAIHCAGRQPQKEETAFRELPPTPRDSCPGQSALLCNVSMHAKGEYPITTHDARPILHHHHSLSNSLSRAMAVIPCRHRGTHDVTKGDSPIINCCKSRRSTDKRLGASQAAGFSELSYTAPQNCSNAQICLHILAFSQAQASNDHYALP
ncbi:hypothetical protein V8E51_018452 [Hyaloscypha variabilis]